MKQLCIPGDVCWIGAERPRCGGFPIETSYFRICFDLPAPVGKALIRISANTRYCLYVNGEELVRGPCRGDHWRQYCDCVDIAPLLKTGRNDVVVKVTAFPPFEAANDDYSNYGPLWSMSNSAGPMLIVWSDWACGADISTGRADWRYINDNAINWRQQQIAHWMGCTEEVDGAALPHRWLSGGADTGACSGKHSNIDGISGSDVPAPAIKKWNNEIRFGEIPRMLLYERPIKPLLRMECRELPFGSGQTGTPDAEARASAGVVSDDANRPGGGQVGLQVPTQDGAIRIPAGGAYEILLDAERLTTAFVYLRCAGGAGSSVRLLYSEAYSKFDGERIYKEHRADASGELRGVTDIYKPGGGVDTYSPSWFRTFRFIKISVETGNAPLTLYPIQYIETRYPLENDVRFTSKQPWLKPVWDISLRTLELCMHETYEDCPFYEQLQYTVDTRLQMLFTYILGNGAEMQRKTIDEFHASQLPEGILQSRFPSKYPQVIPVFSFHWIFMLADYYMETGDSGLLERYRPTMEGVLAWFKRKAGPSGLVEKLAYWEFADWTEAWGDIDGAPRAALYGPSTINNLTYAYALEAGAGVMDALGYAVLADSYRGEKARILAKVEELCWSEERRLYREGPSYEEYSQHAQLWAVLSGLAKGDRARSIMDAALSDASLVPCSFVMQFFLFRALEEAGMYDRTGQLWQMWSELPGLGLGTVPEIPGKFTRSDCHAWGSLMLHELPRKFLGVSPLEPGYAKILIRPVGLYINEISGEVPTPSGPVAVKWKADGAHFAIEGYTPAPATVALPDGTRNEIPAGPFRYVGRNGGGDWETGFKAAIFDLDGTLVDSYKAWEFAYRKALTAVGHDMTDGEFAELYHMTTDESRAFFRQVHEAQKRPAATMDLTLDSSRSSPSSAASAPTDFTLDSSHSSPSSAASAPMDFTLDSLRSSPSSAASAPTDDSLLDAFVDGIYADISSEMERQYTAVIQEKPHALKYVKSLYDRGVAICVATLTPSVLCNHVLKRLGFLPYLKFLITSDDVGLSKKHPDIFLAAAKRLGGDPSETVVFEDCPTAVKTAYDAGFIVCGVADRHRTQDIAESSAYYRWRIGNYKEAL